MKQAKREQRALQRDEELQLQEEIERDLEENVRRLWKATRWYAGHESWSFYEGFDQDTWCGCDCNHWNREALKNAIKRLRAWRTRREYWI